MKAKISIISIALFALLVSGCATIFSGTSQTINVKVVDTDTQRLIPATCSVANASGPLNTIVTNPAAILVPKGEGAIHINCRARGYRQLNMAVGDSFNAVTVVNVLFWPGFIVDAVSGAYKKYPSYYVVNMQKVRLK